MVSAFQQQFLLVAIDVEALYSSILQDKGLSCVKHILSQRKCQEWQFNSFVIASLDFILLHNYFVFNGSHFVQVKDLVMGTSFAPSYTNLYLGELERMIMNVEELHSYTSHIALWYRHINNLFGVGWSKRLIIWLYETH